MAECFQNLESNDRQRIEEAKQHLHDIFIQVKDPWLVNGLYDRYILTNCTSFVEVLITVREPHFEHLFAKLSESIRNDKIDVKYRALVLLGYLVQRQPTWLIKITEKPLFKDLIKLLKNETDILLLLNALLVLIILLPYIPALMAPFLPDVFEVFSRLAAMNWNPGKVFEEQLVHMQVGLYALFQRLYGMYPCNFVQYLRNYYKHQRNFSIFVHTIKPMLQTVQMHPLLVINSKDVETSTDRWIELTSHDVVAECESYSIGFKDRCFGQDTCIAGSAFRSRSGTTNSSIAESPYQFLKNLSMNVGAPIDSPSDLIFSPTQMMTQNPHQTPIPNEAAHFQQNAIFKIASFKSQEGTSPPETAIEATPETTPIKDTRQLSGGRHHTNNGSVARALNNFASIRTMNPMIMSSANTTPVHSQPSSPLRFSANPRQQDQANSSFTFISSDQRASAFNQPFPATMTQQHLKRESFAKQRLQKLIQDRSQAQDEGTKQIVPTSPLRIIQPHENNFPALNSRIESNRIESPISLEDEEVVEIVNKSQVCTPKQALRQCDSVLHDDVSAKDDGECDDMEESTEHGSSPCTSGGLHMPNSKQITAFSNNMKRLRHHSQCASDSDGAQSVSEGLASVEKLTTISNLIVRRTNSCPEMKKSPPQVAKSKTLDENEEAPGEMNGHGGENNDAKVVTVTNCDALTQTENFWPMPYEHLFLTIFPASSSSETGDNIIKPSPAPSPAPFYNTSGQERFSYNSSYDYLDRYIDLACQNETTAPSAKSSREHLVYQLLLFERSRRENHATRNRSLVTELTKKKVLEDHNSALTDQVQLQERAFEELKKKVEVMKKEEHCRLKAALDSVNYWELKFKEIDGKFSSLLDKNKDLQKALDLERTKIQETDNKRQEAESSLLNIEAEIKVAREQVQAGKFGREQVEHLNCELILAGETILKYRKRLKDINRPRNSDFELSHLGEVYSNEIKALQQQLEQKLLAMEALKAKSAEYEQSLEHCEEQSKIYKKLLNDVKEECQGKIHAIEGKYKAQLTINRALEGRLAELQGRIGELHQQLEVAGVNKFGSLHSPDTSSCHEVNATLTDKTAGLSAQSSPLSASLASSDGSMALHLTDGKEVKNLLGFLDQKQQPGRSAAAAESELQDSSNL